MKSEGLVPVFFLKIFENTKFWINSIFYGNQQILSFFGIKAIGDKM